MDNVYVATISTIVLYHYGPLLTPPEACLFISYGCVKYRIFAATADVIVDIFQEAAKVYLFIGSGYGGGGEIQRDIAHHQ